MAKFDCFEVFVLFLNLLCLLKNIELLQYVTYVKPRTILTSMGNLLWKLSVWTEISDRQATITFQLAWLLKQCKHWIAIICKTRATIHQIINLKQSFKILNQRIVAISCQFLYVKILHFFALKESEKIWKKVEK